MAVKKVPLKYTFIVLLNYKYYEVELFDWTYFLALQRMRRLYPNTSIFSNIDNNY